MFAFCESFCDLYDLMLAHTEHQKVSVGIHQNGRADGVIPIVVMREASEGCLKTADAERNIAPYTADSLAVNGDGAVGTLARNAACGIIVVAALALGGGVMRDHGVNIAAVDEKCEIRSAEAAVIVIVLRLGENADLEACVLQHAGNDRCSKAGMVNVSIACDNDDVGRVPATRQHIFFCNRKESHSSSFV